MTVILTIPTDGFFDAGMLLQALKQEQNGNIKPSQKAAARNKVGKKLQLMDY
jgi:carnitine O-acetyltransferase